MVPTSPKPLCHKLSNLNQSQPSKTHLKNHLGQALKYSKCPTLIARFWAPTKTLSSYVLPSCNKPKFLICMIDRFFWGSFGELAVDTPNSRWENRDQWGAFRNTSWGNPRACLFLLSTRVTLMLQGHTIYWSLELCLISAISMAAPSTRGGVSTFVFVVCFPVLESGKLNSISMHL